MATGTVKFFNAQKGFGFIQPTDGGADVFVHISAVERAGMSNLNEGQKLSYDVVSDWKDPLSCSMLFSGRFLPLSTPPLNLLFSA